MAFEHRTTKKFWKLYAELADDVREVADRNFELLKRDPRHPSLHFKAIGPDRWSVRIGLNFRALALAQGKVFTWVWIGSHAEYDRLIE